MIKPDSAVKRESLYITVCVIIGSFLMEAVFLIIKKWDITVLNGNILSAAAAILNFFLMAITVQKAVAKEEKQAAATMKLSQSLRMLMLFAAAAIGVALPCFNIVSVLLPLFFPRIAVALRPLFNKRSND